MNPVPRMQLVEVIRGIVTENVTFDAAKALSIARLWQDLYLTVSEDFLRLHRLNRILKLPMDQRKRLYTLYEGVGSVESIDTADAARRESSNGTLAARRLSSGSTPRCPSCSSCMRAWPIRNIAVPVPCS